MTFGRQTTTANPTSADNLGGNRALPETPKWKRIFLSACGVVLLSLAASVSSPSEAENTVFTRSVSGLERVWGGVAGCASVDDAEAIEDALDQRRVPGAEARDYSDCGRRALRTASGALLLDTMEDALEWGGVALGVGQFRVDSSLSWVWGEDIQGDLDVVVPLWSTAGDRSGQGAGLFMQPGLAVWVTPDGTNRIDANLGLVYRTHVSPDVVMGGSVFLDHDFRRGHRRLGVGADLQSGFFHGGVNYYHPLSEWREGRTRHEERALDGIDLRVGAAVEQLRVDGAVGFWNFEGERDEKSDWRAAYELDVGYQVWPGVYLEAGYERNDSDGIQGSRWNAGIAFRFALPGLEGADSAGSMGAPDVFSPVEREKRILYEERLAFISSVASMDLDSARVQELPNTTIEGTLSLDRAQILDEVTLMLDVTGTADLGARAGEGDVTISYTVQSAGAGGAAPDSGLCAASGCEITFAPGQTMADLEITVINDDTRETEEEYVEISPMVDPAFAHLLSVEDTSARITILPSDDFRIYIAGVDDGDDTTLGGGSARATEGQTVNLDLYIGDPAPAGGINLAISVTDSDGDTEADATVTPNVVIAANQQAAQIPVRIAADGNPETDETVTIEVAGGDGFDNLNPAWMIAPPDMASFDLTIAASDNVIAFMDNSPTIVSSSANGRDAGDLILMLNNPVPAGGTSLQVSSSSARIQVPSTIRVPAGDDTATIELTQTSTDRVGDAGLEVTITVRPPADGLPEGWSFGTGGSVSHTFTLRDQVIGFTRNESTRTEESTNQQVMVQVAPITAFEAGETAVLAVSADEATGSSGLTSADYSIAPASLTFAASDGTTPKEVTVTVNADDVAEDDEVIQLTLSGTSLPDGWALGRTTHDVTIPANDKTVVFTQAMSTHMENDGTVMVGLTLNAAAPSAGLPLSVAVSGTGTAAVNTDFQPIADSFTVPGTGPANLSVTLVDDSTSEGAETIVLEISAGTGFPSAQGWSVGSPSMHTLNIMDDDRALSFASPSSTQTEGDANSDVELTVSVTTPPPEDTDVNVNVAVVTASSTAEAADYTLVTTSLTFTSTNVSETVTVTVNADDMAEDDETVILELTGGTDFGATGYGILGNRHTITISANDKTVQFADATSMADEGDTGETTHQIPLSLNFDAPSGGLPLAVATAGSASDGTDFRVESSFTARATPSNARSVNLPVTILGDTTGEGDETIMLTISTGAAFPSAAGWSIGSQSTHEVTIVDNDQAFGFTGTGASQRTELDTDQTATLTVEPTSALEAGQTATLTVTAAQDGSGGLTGSDYSFSPMTLTFDSANSTAQTITVTVHADADAELEERIRFTLEGTSLPEGWTITQDMHVLTIPPNDNTVEFTDATSNLNEGETAELALELSNPAPSGGVTLMISGGNADLSVNSMTVAAGATSSNAAVSVTATPDADAEDDETVTLTIDAVTVTPAGWGAPGSQATHAVTIPANGRTVQFTTASSEIGEGDSGDTVAMVSLTLNAAAPSAGLPLAVAVNGTATGGGTDYDTVAATFTVPGGELTASIPVTVKGDTDGEGHQTVVLTISEGTNFPSADGWSIGTPATHTLTIQDDDLLVGFEMAESDGMENDTANTVSVVVEAVPAPQAGTTLNLNVAVVSADSSAESADYTLDTSTLTLDSSNASGNVMVTILPDDVVESDETVVLELTGGSGFASTGYSLDTSRHTITIPANDLPPELFQVAFLSTSSSASEGASATLQLQISPTAAGAAALGTAMVPTGGLTFNVVTSGTADSGSDYTELPSSITVLDAPASPLLVLNLTAASITIPITDDTEGEDEETIIVTISAGEGFPSAMGWGLGANTTHTVTIAESDGGIPMDGTLGFMTTEREIGAVKEVQNLDEIELVIVETSETPIRAPRAISLVLSSDHHTGTVSGRILLPDTPPVLRSGQSRVTAVVEFGTPVADEETEIELSSEDLPDGWSIDPERDTFTIIWLDDTRSSASFAGTDENAMEGQTVAVEVNLNLRAPADGVTVTVTTDSDDINFDNGQKSVELVIDEGERTGTVNVVIIDDDEEEGLEEALIVLESVSPPPWDIRQNRRDFEINIAPSDMQQ